MANYDVSIKLTPKQLAVQKELFAGEKRFIRLSGGSRSGKTFYAFYYLVKRALLYPGSFGLVFRKTLSSLKIGMIHQTMPNVWEVMAANNGGLHPYRAKVNGVPIVNYNKSEQVLTFFNGSKIFFYGAAATAGNIDSLTKILSSEYFTILVEEGNENSFEVIEKLFTRLTQTVKSVTGKTGVPKFITTLNPTNFDSWDYVLFSELKNPISKEPVLHPERYGVAHFSPLDNLEHISEDYLDTLRSLSPIERRRFLEGEYGNYFVGKIFTHLTWEDVDDFSVFERICIYVDPSYKSGHGADFKSVATVGIVDGSFYVLDVNAAQCTTYVMIELIHVAQSYVSKKLEKCRRFPQVETWIENKGVSDDFNKAHAAYCANNGCAIPYKWDTSAKGDKFNRIESLLVPLNEQSRLIFSNHIRSKAIGPQVEVQFMNFAPQMPKDMHDDIPDSVHGAVYKLSKKKTVTTLKDIDLYKTNWH